MKLLILAAALALAGCGSDDQHGKLLDAGCTLKHRGVTTQACYRGSCTDVITNTYSCAAREVTFRG